MDRATGAYNDAWAANEEYGSHFYTMKKEEKARYYIS